MTQPLSALSMSRQMSTPATNGTTYGRKNSTRNPPEPRRWRECSISATSSGRTIASGSARTANLRVTSSDAQACWSASRVS